MRAGPCGMSRAGWAAREGERWAAGKWCARGLKGGVRAGPSGLVFWVFGVPFLFLVLFYF